MEKNELLQSLLIQSRTKAKRSQEYMSLELGVARKTIQNWESGASEPSVSQLVRWFEILEISPIPYMLQLSHPAIEGITSHNSDQELRLALLQVINGIPDEGMRQLLYLFYGDHGSSPRAVLNMVTAHLQTPMKDRVTQGSVILKNYEMARKQNKLTGPDHIQPDVDLLQRAIDHGEDAAVQNKEAYFIQKKYFF